MEADLVRPWLSLVAIKDMLWEKGKNGWRVTSCPPAKASSNGTRCARG